MKQKLFSMIALLLMAATGAWAQSSETVPTTKEAANKWSLTMPAADVEVQVEYKTVTTTTVFYDGEPITADGISVAMGTESTFAEKLTATVTDADNQTVTSPTFTYTSSDPTVVAFGDDNEPSGALADIKFLKGGNVSLTVQYNGTDDLGRSTATLPLTVLESTYSVSLNDNNVDPNNWTGKVGEAGDFTTLPLEGVNANQTVTVKYDGTRQVKRIKAVKKTVVPPTTMAADATAADKNKLICTDGHIHAYGEDDGCTKERVARIIYVGATGDATYSHGLALALADEGEFYWNDAMTACSNKNTTTPVANATWILASKDQWDLMKGTSGAGNRSNLRDGFSSVGGTNMLNNGSDYWSSTEADPGYVWAYNIRDDKWLDFKATTWKHYVRACLAF